LRVLPSKPELAFFNSQVDELKLGADRVEARIEHFITRIARQGSEPNNRNKNS
jgi:ubiquinone biosynthesis protein UbiJ